MLVASSLVHTFIKNDRDVDGNNGIEIIDIKEGNTLKFMSLSQSESFEKTVRRKYVYKSLSLKLMIDEGDFVFTWHDHMNNDFEIVGSTATGLRNSYSLTVTEYDGEYCIVETEQSYGLAGVEEKGIFTIHNIHQNSKVELTYQTKINISNYNDGELPIAGTAENPFYFNISNESVSEAAFVEELNKFIHEKGTVLLTLGYGGAGTIEVYGQSN